MLVCESKCLRIRPSFLVRGLLTVFGLNSEDLRHPIYRLWKGRRVRVESQINACW